MGPWVERDSHGSVLHPAAPPDWQELVTDYGGERPAPVEQIFEVVRQSDCRTVVVENRYVDMDYRSGYSAFWSLRFQTSAPFARRLHFFTEHLDQSRVHQLPENVGHLGYRVLRPVPGGRVGRTVLAPPPSLSGAALATIEDRVSLFGNELTVEGVPFCQQDGECLRCAHVAAWICHYTGHRVGLVGRCTTAAIAESSPPMVSLERALPSKGMTLNQLQAVFGALGRPALFYGLSNMPTVRGVPNPTPQIDERGEQLPAGLWDTRMFSVICRYLNSGFPVLIGTTDHAFVLVGWLRDGEHVRFIACDDQVGPYELIDSPFSHREAPWQSMMIPLPTKVFLGGESAENAAYETISALATGDLKPLAQALAAGTVQLRSSLRTGSDFKRAVDAQARSDEVLRLVRLARLPHWAWTVEAHVRSACDAEQDCVIAEVVLDSTSCDLSPREDVIALPGLVATFPPDGGEVQTTDAGVRPWASLLTAH